MQDAIVTKSVLNIPGYMTKAADFRKRGLYPGNLLTLRKETDQFVDCDGNTFSMEYVFSKPGWFHIVKDLTPKK